MWRLLYKGKLKVFVLLLICLWGCFETFAQKAPQNYIFFNRERNRIKDSTFLYSSQIKGAQLKYTWKELEPEKGHYHFNQISEDLEFLKKHGKGLFIQIQDVSFDTSIINVPNYLITDSIYSGGVAVQYTQIREREKYLPEGYIARRWDTAVAQRFHQLLIHLGEHFDGKIVGINLPETSIEMGVESMHPAGFTYESYFKAIIDNMKVLKRAFPKSAALLYANFMPGDEFPLKETAFLVRLYEYAQEIKLGMGGPDIKVHKWWPMRHSYPLLREKASSITTGMAVQWGNYDLINPKTKKQVTIEEISLFGKEYLQLDYIFWGTQEPHYTNHLIPFLNR